MVADLQEISQISSRIDTLIPTPTEVFSEKKYEKLGMNPLKSDTVIAICMQRDPAASLPEWEELAAVSMAVQNLWLTATAYGLGGYWSSPKLVDHAGELLELRAGERCYGFFYLGHHRAPTLPRKRGDWEEKVVWME